MNVEIIIFLKDSIAITRNLIKEDFKKQILIYTKINKMVNLKELDL